MKLRIAKDLTMFHHDCQEFDDNFGGRSDKDLTLPSLLCVVDNL